MLEHERHIRSRPLEETAKIDEAQQQKMTIRQGDLVRIQNEEWLPPETPQQTARFLFASPDEDSGLIKGWVGPVDMSPREVHEFQEAYKVGGQHQEKYAGFYSIDMSRLTKLGDS